MALINKTKLSIAIPTYNRAKFLERCLKFLADQKEDFNGEIEILVSDNCSTDNTGSIVNKFQQLGLEIRYIKNTENIGPDLNILQCYKEAKGEYILAMGDDDALLIGAVKNIIKIIDDNDKIGTIFLTPANIDRISNNNITNPLSYKVFTNIVSYLHRVNYFTTFISANIINRQALSYVDTNKWLNSNLTQVPIILNAIKIKEAKNIVVNTHLLAAQNDNSGGYNFFKVFGYNFNLIMKDVFSYNDRYRRIINNHIFISFFPHAMIKLKNGNHEFDSINSKELINLLSYNIYFWLYTYPILKLPAPLDKWFFSTVFFFDRIRKKALFTIFSK